MRKVTAIVLRDSLKFHFRFLSKNSKEWNNSGATSFDDSIQPNSLNTFYSLYCVYQKRLKSTSINQTIRPLNQMLLSFP